MPSQSTNDEVDEILNENPMVSYGYAWGAKDVPPQSDDCFARVVEEPGRAARFFVMFCSYGNDSGGMRNPMSPFYVSGNDYLGRLGQHRYTFREVKHEAFTSYLMFLKTQNQVHLRQAERANQ